MTSPSDLQVLKKAEALCAEGRFAEAEGLCSEVLARDEQSPAAWNLRGHCRASLGRYGEALPDFKRARLLLPVYAPIRYNLGKALEETGDAGGALSEYDEALKLEPGMVAALHCRGALRLSAGDLEGARGDLEKAASLAPDEAESYVLRGVLRLAEGRSEQAEGDFAKALALDPSQQERVAEYRRAYRSERGA